MRERGEPYRGRVPVIVAGARRIFDVVEVPTPRRQRRRRHRRDRGGKMRAEIARMVDAHRRTLDQLATGVAIFGADQTLAFYNAAYRALWDLDAGFPRSEPDRFRRARPAARRAQAPRAAGFPQLEKPAARSLPRARPREHEWHLPDGRTLRVVTTPNPEGGVTYLFDDVTERLDLERRFDALIRVQGETLDNLAEGGRGVRQRRAAATCTIRPSRSMWKLAPEALADRASAHRGRHRLVRAAARG